MLGKLRSTKGQAILELALVLPILLLLVFGITEFGRIFNASLVITQAAREGVRVGVVGGSDADITTAVKTVAANLDVDKLEIHIDPPEPPVGSRVRGSSLRVEVDYSVPVVVPVIAAIVPNPYPLKAVAVMRVE